MQMAKMILAWVAGVFLILAGLVNIAQGAWGLVAVAGLLLLPPVGKLLEDKAKIPLKPAVKVVVVAVCLIVAVATTPTKENATEGENAPTKPAPVAQPAKPAEPVHAAKPAPKPAPPEEKKHGLNKAERQKVFVAAKAADERARLELWPKYFATDPNNLKPGFEFRLTRKTPLLLGAVTSLSIGPTLEPGVFVKIVKKVPGAGGGNFFQVQVALDAVDSLKSLKQFGYARDGHIKSTALFGQDLLDANKAAAYEKALAAKVKKYRKALATEHKLSPDQLADIVAEGEREKWPVK